MKTEKKLSENETDETHTFCKITKLCCCHIMLMGLPNEQNPFYPCANRISKHDNNKKKPMNINGNKFYPTRVYFAHDNRARPRVWPTTTNCQFQCSEFSVFFSIVDFIMSRFYCSLKCFNVFAHVFYVKLCCCSPRVDADLNWIESVTETMRNTVAIVFGSP